MSEKAKDHLSECKDCSLKKGDTEISEQLDHCTLQRAITNGNIISALGLANNSIMQKDCVPRNRMINIREDLHRMDART
ncbi:hypothetical protein ACFL10_01140 [Patescibacteria group bacterium]